MTPYFELDGITIYHADCADVLPDIDPDDVGLLLTDPPYGIDLLGGSKSVGGSGWADVNEYPPIHGDDEPFNPKPLLLFGRCVLFGANYFAQQLPPSGWIVWDKKQREWEDTFSDGEVAWTNLSKRIHIYRQTWMGAVRSFSDGDNSNRVHPTQKPVALMRWILEKWTKPGDLILDPYMGSGPIAQACFELNRRYIGIEIEEEYCAVTVERRFNQMSLFT